METGYEDTPYVKGSKKTKPKKGTGKGVCPVTSKPHDKLWVYAYNSFVNPKNYWQLYNGRYACMLHNYCVDCGKYRENKYFREETLRKCQEAVQAFTGQDWDKILFVHLTAKDRLR